MPSENRTPDGHSRPPADQRGADAGDLVVAALDFLRRVQEAGGGPSGPPSLAGQEASLLRWADGLGLLLIPDQIIPFLDRGGQEHDILKQGERVLKVTRNGVFGLSPGIGREPPSARTTARREEPAARRSSSRRSAIASRKRMRPMTGSNSSSAVRSSLRPSSLPFATKPTSSPPSSRPSPRTPNVATIEPPFILMLSSLTPQPPSFP